jgi:hypothetical protein
MDNELQKKYVQHKKITEAEENPFLLAGIPKPGANAFLAFDKPPPNYFLPPLSPAIFTPPPPIPDPSLILRHKSLQ